MTQEKIIIVSGYFDPLHAGHIECMQLAKNLGDKLIIILNTDEQCKIKKGFAFMPQNEKKKILETLKHVDEVFISVDKDASVCESIKVISKKYPNNKIIFAKGGDRFIYEIPETKLCKELNIDVVDGLGEKIQSSSDLIKNAEEKKKQNDTNKHPL
ncbi:MAG: adenylyltransferase/cytidyltransferase family protein [archaeon]